MKIRDLIELLKSKEQTLEVEFIVVEPDTSVVCMEITDDVADVMKLMKAFKKTSKRAASAAKGE